MKRVDRLKPDTEQVILAQLVIDGSNEFSRRNECAWTGISAVLQILRCTLVIKFNQILNQISV